MKILIPFNKDSQGKGFNDPIVTGGIEKFCSLIYEQFDDVEILEITNVKDFKTNTTIIKNTAIECNADIIISNWCNAAFSGANLVGSPIPILLICHECSGRLSILSTFNRLKEYGHSVCLVNPYQRNYYDAFAKRLKIDSVDFDGCIDPAFLTGEKPKLNENPEFDCVTIGRCDPDYKMPFRIKSMLKDTDFRTLLMTNAEKEILNALDKDTGRSYNYYQKNKHWDDCLYDLPHNEVMKNLQRGRTYFMTWEDECFPIVGLEALSYGLPLILNSRMMEDRGPPKRQNFKYPLHGGDLWAEDPFHFTNIRLNSKEELIDAINKYKDIDRQEIIDMTWDKYTEKRWKQILNNAIDKTMENFKSSRVVLPI